MEKKNNMAKKKKKRWQEYTKKLYRKDLHGPDNHDGVITHLEPDFVPIPYYFDYCSFVV